MHIDYRKNRLAALLDRPSENRAKQGEVAGNNGERGSAMGDMPAMNNDSSIKIHAGKRLRMATSADNAEILSQIRELVRRELSNLHLDGAFDLKKATILHKLAQTYAILDCHVDKEHRKYDLTGKTDAELALLEEAARLRLEK